MRKNIPAEMRALPQWCYSLPSNKVPLNPSTGTLASVTDPSTWSSFDKACEAADSHKGHVGFVLTKDDPYLVIDFDDPYTKYNNKDGSRRYDDTECRRIIDLQQHIRSESTETYEELSKSGRGLHIIGKGSVPTGKKKNEVEIYSSERYIICTGNIVTNSPVANMQDVADHLYNEMGGSDNGNAELIEVGSIVSDAALLERARSAANADKFERLWRGDINGYASQSEADYALLSMLAFYTPSNNQVRRTFRMSALGQRAKATRDDKYLNRTLKHLRAKEVPAIDFTELLNNHDAEQRNDILDFTELYSNYGLKSSDDFVPDVPVENDVVENEVDKSDVAIDAAEEETSVGVIETIDDKEEDKSSVPYPPGTMGELARFFKKNMIAPLHETAIAAAIGFSAGVAGRQYHTYTHSGLNCYLIIVAYSGAGKEGTKGSIADFAKRLRAEVPTVDDFIGAEQLASGQAIYMAVRDQPSAVHFIPEFGKTLTTINSRMAPSHDQTKVTALLNLYGKSGPRNDLGKAVFADKAKNVESVEAPNFTFIGDTPPEPLFDNLSFGSFEDGLITRLTFIEYNGLKPYDNPDTNHAPPPGLIRKYIALVEAAAKLNNTNQYIMVEPTPEARRILDEYGHTVTDQYNALPKGCAEQILINRTRLKALRYSALVGACDNPYRPIVTKEAARWGIAFAESSDNVVKKRLKEQTIGNGESRQEGEIKRLVAKYLKMTQKKRMAYKIPKEVAETGLIHTQFFRRRCARMKCFTDDKRGLNEAIKKILRVMVDSDVLVEIPPQKARDHYGISCRLSAPLYAKGSNW
jgi:hypothetical protein